MNKNENQTKLAETISKNIQFLMKEHNLNIEEFAKETNLNCHRVKSLINKSAKRLSVLDILKIVVTFGISSDWFVGRRD